MSGEYAMIKASERGWLDHDHDGAVNVYQTCRVSLISTYFAKEAAILLNKK
jgi:porphobilinogen synthase